jgi:hypothetical protein
VTLKLLQNKSGPLVKRAVAVTKISAKENKDIKGIASIYSLEKLIKEGWSSIVNGSLF